MAPTSKLAWEMGFNAIPSPKSQQASKPKLPKPGKGNT